ncbi:MAG: hypothetical protein V1822_00120 [Candidatus Micrarchaeota archaeon]
MKKKAMSMSKESCGCCTEFPIFKWLILLVALVWIATEMGYIALNIPWLPVIIALVVLKMLMKHYNCCS